MQKDAEISYFGIFLSISDGRLRFVYSSSGEKLAAIATDDQGNRSTTYYRGEFTYLKPEGGTEMLHPIHHPEGIINRDFVYFRMGKCFVGVGVCLIHGSVKKY